MQQKSAAKILVEMMNLIYQNNLTTVSGGNLSILAEDGSMWITPTGVDKGALTEADIVCVSADGKIAGKNRPSIEYPFHQKIYEVSPHIKAIIHVHSPNLIASSILRAVPPIHMLPHCAKAVGRVDIAPYDIPGGYALGEKISAVFARGNDCVIMENHGVVLGADTMPHAFDRLESLDFLFELQARSKILGNPQTPSSEELSPWEKKGSSAGIPAKTPQFTAALHPYVKRFYQKKFSLTNPDLFCVSYRTEDGMLTNPADVPLYALAQDSYVQVNADTAFNYHQMVHLAIYRNKPEINCIMTGISPNAMAFAVTATPLQTTIIPESFMVLQNVALLPYQAYGNIDQILATLKPSTNEILFQNGCYLCCGPTPLKMYDRVEVLEYSAKAVLDAQYVGKIVYISEQQIDDLIETFHMER